MQPSHGHLFEQCQEICNIKYKNMKSSLFKSDVPGLMENAIRPLICRIYFESVCSYSGHASVFNVLFLF